MNYNNNSYHYLMIISLNFYSLLARLANIQSDTNNKTIMVHDFYSLCGGRRKEDTNIHCISDHRVSSQECNAKL